MLFAVTGLLGCPIKAGDGDVGSVKDFLFDDRSWKVRWMVVSYAGKWVTEWVKRRISYRRLLRFRL